MTVHHNWFDRTSERHPRARFGRVHAFNNLYDHWGFYGIASSQRAQVVSERSIFDAGDNADAIIDQAGSDPEPGRVRSTGDWLLGGAQVRDNEPDQVFDPAALYGYEADEADDALREAIEAGAGPPSS